MKGDTLMETIIQVLERYTQQEPNAAILFDDAHAKGLTYAQLDEMSGKVYGWLKGQGIGREDFVLINLPRGVLPIVAMIGVWKAGAAWALVEDTYAPDRIAFIRKDCGCKAELCGDNWDEVMRGGTWRAMRPWTPTTPPMPSTPPAPPATPRACCMSLAT